MSIKEIRTVLCSPRATIHTASDTYVKSIAGMRYPNYTPRMLGLAYTYLRGASYRVAEPTARPISEHYSWAPFRSNLMVLINHAQRDDSEAVPVTKEIITAWLAAPEPEAHLTRRLAAEEKSRQVRMARRSEHARKQVA